MATWEQEKDTVIMNTFNNLSTNNKAFVLSTMSSITGLPVGATFEVTCPNNAYPVEIMNCVNQMLSVKGVKSGCIKFQGQTLTFKKIN